MLRSVTQISANSKLGIALEELVDFNLWHCFIVQHPVSKVIAALKEGNGKILCIWNSLGAVKTALPATDPFELAPPAAVLVPTPGQFGWRR